MLLFQKSVESKTDLLSKSNMNGIFREAIWPFLVIGQCFGVMPVIGVKSTSLADIRFKWKSIRTVHSLTVATLLLSYSIFAIWRACNDSLDVSSISAVAFYVPNTYAYISLLDLARKWPKLMQRWDLAESTLPHFRYQRQHAHFIWKIRFFSITILFLAIFENFFYAASLFHFVTTVDSKQDPLMFIVENSVPYTFSTSQTQSYPIWVAIPINFISLTSTFVWNYLDALVLIISIGLSTLFQLFNDELMEIREQMPQQFWAHRRVQYETLCNLIKTVDRRISHMIFVSFATNLFFICKQLFENMRPTYPTVYLIAYFWYSLAFSIVRTLAVSLFAARVNDESTRPIWILRSISADSWKTESKRLFNEVVNNSISLSGLQFFFLTRKLVLSMAGTIITYELVLLQLQPNQNSTTPTNSTIK